MAISGEPLAGKVALVTGGTRGIGAAISRKLAAWGCELCLGYVDRDAAAAELTAELRTNGNNVHLLKADIADPEQIDEMFARFETHHDSLDILVLNAASGVYRRWQDLTVQQWAYVLETNTRANWLLAKRARPLMTGRSGRIINLSSYASVSYTDGIGPMGAAKAAIESMTRSLAVEFAADGIVVNCIRAGRVPTDIASVRPGFTERLDADRARSPWGRATTPEDCANVVALLCLDEASWICGQTIVVDGAISVCP